MIEFARKNVVVKWLLIVVRVMLGWYWFKAALNKLQKGNFDATQYISGAIEKSQGAKPSIPDWWGQFLESVVMPNIQIFNFIVPVGELLVGIGLIVGLFTKTAAFFGFMMNYAFFLSGSVSLNPTMIIASLLILISLHQAGSIGLDGLIRSRNFSFFNKQKGVSAQT
ncbi:DoxX family protein [Paenibacillus sp. 481]|uniref:DoxX family protein n=1 Tax=Paenibacillus sp. 481 TaxID=2835869 RepID=UPI001E292DD6|nr:DoxX family membrane protein [Paenibacillus sp. 481]UHA75228.1 DoxX family membrane protein [Paenibacillus sp. 481]